MEDDDLLNPESFVEFLIDHVRVPAIEGTTATMQEPPGRAPRQDLVQLSRWFNDLPEADRDLVVRAMTMAVDDSLFGILCVLDGVRSINPRPGVLQSLVLHAELEDGTSRRLNPEDGELHDTYNWLTRDQYEQGAT
ncbi:hypothetical protein GCM10027589_00880 [Actinocorallia lasiicapitis]